MTTRSFIKRFFVSKPRAAPGDGRQNPELADIPVIMVSIVDEHRRGIALGAAGYLTKPIDRERLHQLVRRFQTPTRPTRVLMVEDDVAQRDP